MSATVSRVWLTLSWFKGNQSRCPIHVWVRGKLLKWVTTLQNRRVKTRLQVEFASVVAKLQVFASSYRLQQHAVSDVISAWTLRMFQQTPFVDITGRQRLQRPRSNVNKISAVWQDEVEVFRSERAFQTELAVYQRAKIKFTGKQCRRCWTRLRRPCFFLQTWPNFSS